MFIVKRSTNHCSLCSIREVVPPLEHPKVVTRFSQHTLPWHFFCSPNVSTVLHTPTTQVQCHWFSFAIVNMINLSYPAQIPLSVWSAPRTSRDPRRRDWNMIIYSYVSWGNVVSVWPWEKACFFFLKLRFLLRERICFNGLALTACRTACWF